MPMPAYTLLRFCLLFLGAGAVAAAQGVEFLTLDIEQLVNRADEQGKLVFVEVYLDGCPHCEALAPVLEEDEVGLFFNQHFVSGKVEANAPLSKSLQIKKNLHYPEFPLLLFFDAGGRLVHQATPAEHSDRAAFVEEVLRHGQNALRPETRTGGYALRYQSGERNVGFLIDYAKYTKTTRDTTQLIALTDELARQLSTSDALESPAGFYVIGRLVPDFDNPMARYFFSHLENYRTRYGAKETQQAGESVLFNGLFGRNGHRLSSGQVVAMRKAMESLGLPARVAAMRTILKELEALLRERDTAAAVARFDAYRQSTPLRTTDYAYLLRFFNEKAPDASYAAALVTWAEAALGAVPPNEKNSAAVAELYREQSEAYRQLGKKKEGKQAAERALMVARLAGEEAGTFERQLGKFD